MNIILYKSTYEQDDAIENFTDLFFSSQMPYLASDLLDEGLSPGEITDALRRAMDSARAARLYLRRHFAPVYTQRGGSIVKDCKLSQLGYALVLLNANPTTPAVARWQVQVLRKYFN
ncbi:MAG: damage-inducible protein D [Bacteroidetes bacterium]|nr:MAG: damage-inducible protein D [Bacteroidota bacterium]